MLTYNYHRLFNQKLISVNIDDVVITLKIIIFIFTCQLKKQCMCLIFVVNAQSYIFTPNIAFLKKVGVFPKQHANH